MVQFVTAQLPSFLALQNAEIAIESGGSRRCSEPRAADASWALSKCYEYFASILFLNFDQQHETSTTSQPSTKEESTPAALDPLKSFFWYGILCYCLHS
jgi:hypothetical protein